MGDINKYWLVCNQFARIIGVHHLHCIFVTASNSMYNISFCYQH